ncbi:TPA: NAD-dependent epimerase/dehydratase family protein [Candidatus Poribacteria bacterium]|nr:NAD-dependent epimerase/dehydratase family protein [Flavobacteriales bacterium]HIM12180.1 NAD-dependent epimerase/dehydratase family protein [Candidatus Poribacteria bacterium]HIO78795.1 NAD-dependent epimerase/dehydratase family protein [Candidatus Poribacteria bacterium]
MEIRNSKILVIGGAGLIGSHIVEELVQEDIGKLVILDNFTRGKLENIEHVLQDERVEYYEGDITHVDVLDYVVKGADYVFHLAALWLLHCHEFPRASFEVNIAGTFNVLEACVKNNVEKLIYSSSASVYGDSLETPMTENHPYNNQTFYGATKIAGEHMCRAFFHRYGLHYVGLRYMNVYGPRQDYRSAYTSVIMKVLDQIDLGKSPVVYGDGSQVYDFIHVRDVARANVCALKGDTTDNFYNVGCGIKTTIKELVELLLELTRCNLEIQYEPAGLIFVTNRVGSTDKAEYELNFKSEVDLKQGLVDTIRWRNQQTDTGIYPV